MSISYRDALLLTNKVVDSKVKSAPKKIYKTFSTGEIKKMCVWGKLGELKQVNPAVFTKLAIELFVKTMSDKLAEIEMWKCEDKNQYEDVLIELTERTDAIKKCMEYVKSFSKSESSESVNTKPDDIYTICFDGNHEELCKVDTGKISFTMIEHLIIKLKEKIMEIEMWKSEEQNQTDEKQTELINRSNGILICINYLGRLYQKANDNSIDV
jgi:hypothetical protein